MFLAHLLQSITCSWTISCGRHVPGPSVTGPSRVPGPSVAGPSHVPGPSVAGPSCLPGPSVAGPEFQDHAPVAGTNTVLHTNPSCSEETLQLACLESSMTSKTLKDCRKRVFEECNKETVECTPKYQALCCTNDTSPFQTRNSC